MFLSFDKTHASMALYSLIRNIGSSFQNLFRRCIRKSSYLCTQLIITIKMKRLIIMALAAMTLGANAQQKLYLTIGGITKTATLVSNSSTEALVAQLQQGNITYEAHDYGNFEKVGPLGYTFPENNEQINTVPGDLILYQGSNLCIYYDTNSWNFTRIGKLDNMTQADIKTWVNAGGENVSVTLSVSELTGISKVKADETKSQAYTLMGTLAQDGHKGIVIQNGKKVAIK